MPSLTPRVGKISAAIMLNKNITEIDVAMSSSLALITGAVAAMAEPPQIDEPTPTRVAMSESIFKTFAAAKAIISAVEIVERIISRDDLPTTIISPRFSPKPKRTTASCKTFFDVNFMPASRDSGLLKLFKMIPKSIPKTGPPITGNFLPKK